MTLEELIAEYQQLSEQLDALRQQVDATTARLAELDQLIAEAQQEP